MELIPYHIYRLPMPREIEKKQLIKTYLAKRRPVSDTDVQTLLKRTKILVLVVNMQVTNFKFQTIPFGFIVFPYLNQKLTEQMFYGANYYMYLCLLSLLYHIRF